MKIKLLLATIVGAVAINGAVAGTYCAPPADCAKCPVECCDELQGNIGASYMTDYFFRGVRYAREAVGVHASYELYACNIPINVGFNHITSLTSTTANYLGGDGDHTNLFAAIQLPSLCGFDLGLRYDHYLYPNLRQDDTSPNAARNWGDSHGALGLSIAREILCGITLSATSQYDFNSPSAQVPFSRANGANVDDGAWIHTIGLNKSICISECVSLDLSGGVLYTDNVWDPNYAGVNTGGAQRSAGWNNYFLEAALPICVGKCATLSPYVGYNGTPDGWIADGIFNGIPGANRNDAVYGGVRFNTKF